MNEKFEITLTVNDGIGVLEWAGQTDQATLDRAVSLAADDALIGREVDRLEVQIPADDQMAMRALHRARFRREGCRRNAVRRPDGGWQHVFIYARLAIDQVYGPDGFSGVMNTVLPTHRLIGHVLFRDQAGRILLVETTYKDDWELPGGVVEPNETPRAGAEREVLEELGIGVRLAQPLVVDWMPPYLGWDDAVEFIFDGGVLDQATIDQMELPETEIRAFRWVFEDEMDDHIFSLSSRRLHRLLAGPTTIYTEDGRELP
ncbi:NUDIX hydrolase [Brooklawnia sp.]|uniref:NUDIX hydrolase n=1 Tax=Brooklawnia sp. TaxID=2699740 RepID=UPI00311ED18F